MPYFQPRLVLPSSLTFRDKTVLITGASAGMGLAAIKPILIRGAKEIILGVRSVSKAETATAPILRDAQVKKKNPGGKITILHIDAEDYDSVLHFAKEVKQRYDGKLDMALLNAATGSLKWEVVKKTGHEKIIQVNLLSAALLALELIPTLEKTATVKNVPSRLTWVGSFVQFDHTFEKKPLKPDESVLEHLDNEENFVAMGRYPDSKMLGTMFVEQLARHVDPEKVVINDVNPGMVATGFGEYPFWLRAIFGLLFAFSARNAEAGAKTYLHGLGVAGKESHGQYLSDNRLAERAPFTQSTAGKNVRDRLWDDIWKECTKIDPTLQRLTRVVS